MSKKTGLILLSGGLDSVVSIASSNCDVKFALIFDYGQIAFKEEYKSAKKIAQYYNIELETIKLDWLKNIISNGLTDSTININIKDLSDENALNDSMKSVWVPNRNALFVNIAACYCEAKNIDTIIIGANKEESKTFKDNSKDFILSANELLLNSTNKKIELVAPLIDMDKNEIVKLGLDLSVPIDLIYSCYKGGEKHCGECESCQHLKQALKKNNEKDLLKKLF